MNQDKSHHSHHEYDYNAHPCWDHKRDSKYLAAAFSVTNFCLSL